MVVETCESVKNPFYFANWDPKHAQLWDNEPVCLQHKLVQSPLFSRDALARLIEYYPREHYSIIKMGSPGEHRRYWREGDLGDLSGYEVLDAIENGRLWLNLRSTNLVDIRYNDLIEGMFAELNKYMPDFVSWDHRCGILVSSPNAQVYFHADLPGQALFQILGHKRVYLYPNHKPFITPEHLEHIAIYGIEVDVPYEGWYDEYASIYDFEPGQMLAWPLNAPHRVENLDCLNVSMTVEYMTEPIRRANVLTRANGILRYRVGWSPRSYALGGPTYWAKAALQKALRQTSWMNKPKMGRRPIEFHLDRQTSDSIIHADINRMKKNRAKGAGRVGAS
jgi:hypothetical protein